MPLKTERRNAFIRAQKMRWMYESAVFKGWIEVLCQKLQ